MSNIDSGKGFGNLFHKVKENQGAPQAQPPAAPNWNTGALTRPATSTLPNRSLERPPEMKTEDLQKPLTFVMAYLKAPSTVPAFRDPTYVDTIVSAEGNCPSENCGNLGAKLKRLLAHAEPYFLKDDDVAIPGFEPGPDAGSSRPTCRGTGTSRPCCSWC